LSQSGKDTLTDDERKQVEDSLMQLLGREVKPDIRVYQRAMAYLASDLASSEETVDKFRAAARERLPLAMCFASPEEKHARKEVWAQEDAEEEKVTEVNGTA
jgi:hypothetical protein